MFYVYMEPYGLWQTCPCPLCTCLAWSPLIYYRFCVFSPQSTCGLWASPPESYSLFLLLSQQVDLLLLDHSSSAIPAPSPLLPLYSQTPFLAKISVLAQLPARLPTNYQPTFSPAGVANQCGQFSNEIFQANVVITYSSENPSSAINRCAHFHITRVDPWAKYLHSFHNLLAQVAPTSWMGCSMQGIISNILQRMKSTSHSTISATVYIPRRRNISHLGTGVSWRWDICHLVPGVSSTKHQSGLPTVNRTEVS